MVKKPIVWSEKALQELEDILDFYNNRNQSTSFSQKILTFTESVLHAIAENERIGRKSKFDKIRVFPLKQFLIIYEISHNQIEVLSFWDNRQNPEKRKP